MADRVDLAEDRADYARVGNLRDPPDPRGVLLPVDDQAGEQGRRLRLEMGAVRRHPLAANVLQTLPHLSRDATSLEAVHRRLVAQHRGLESY